MSLFSRSVVAITHNDVVRKLVTGTPPGRAVAERFVAGDTLDDGATATAELNRAGKSVSMDLLGEAVHDRTTAIAAADQYEAAVHRIAEDGLDANISVKLTQLGLDVDRGLAAENIDRLAGSAKMAGTTVTIDMEDSRYTSDTIELFEQGQRAHGNLGVSRRPCEELPRIWNGCSRWAVTSGCARGRTWNPKRLPSPRSMTSMRPSCASSNRSWPTTTCDRASPPTTTASSNGLSNWPVLARAHGSFRCCTAYGLI
jgi:hypothetical protein